MALLTELCPDREPRCRRSPAGSGRAARDPAPARPAPLTPAQAFDALYAFCAPALVRQTYLLTGRRELARESVERAFQLAWQRWPEVAVDRDPAGWVRAAAYEYAMSPWHRFRPRYRHPEPPPARRGRPRAARRAARPAAAVPPHAAALRRRRARAAGDRRRDGGEHARDGEPAAARARGHRRAAARARRPRRAPPAAGRGGLHGATARGPTAGGPDRRRAPGALLDPGGDRLRGGPDRDDGAHPAHGPHAVRASARPGRAGAGRAAAEWPRARCRRRRRSCGRSCATDDWRTARSGSYPLMN